MWLVSQRIEMVERAWRAKAELGLPLVDAPQEERVYARARRWARQYQLSPAAVEQLFRAIVDEGKLRALRDARPRTRSRMRSTKLKQR